MSINRVVADYVTNWLKGNGKSYQWLADELGVSKSLVQHMVNGNRSFTSERIFQLSKIFDVSIDELIDEKQSTFGYAVHLRGEISTREGQSTLDHIIFSCLKDDELFYVEEVLKKGVKS